MVEAVLERKENKVIFESDPLFSCIVPIYNIHEAILKRCLMSLSEQNYKNMEVVLVFDGKDELLEKVAKPYLESHKNWKSIIIEHKGACAARNAGFDVSSGEIVAFVNSDYVLKRGIIRLWVDRLLENKDCGFAYGGYEYNSKERAWYESTRFDPYQLEVENYIDCGFPVWRKYAVRWDETVKSLQDWDFWIRVVKTHGVKGYYMGRDVSFVAEPPRPKGLTDDSSHNWIERVRYVKEKNGIPLRDILVLSTGAQNHALEIAKSIDADFRTETILKPHEYKALYMIGFYMKPGTRNMNGAIMSHFGDKVKKIIHWVGADIYWLRKFSYEDLKNLGGALRVSAIHLVENELAKKELKDLLGIDAIIVPIPPYNDYEKKPLPENFSVGIFLTNYSDFDKYYKEHTLSLVRACPDIQFNSYGDGADDVKYRNLKNFGKLSKSEWKEFVYNNSCLIRLTKHDTTPLANNEFMMAGRSVISNIPGECTHYIDTRGTSPVNEWDVFQPGFAVDNWADTKKKIVQTIRSIKRGDKFEIKDVSDRFNREKYVNTIYELCELKRRIK